MMLCGTGRRRHFVEISSGPCFCPGFLALRNVHGRGEVLYYSWVNGQRIGGSESSGEYLSGGWCKCFLVEKKYRGNYLPHTHPHTHTSGNPGRQRYVPRPWAPVLTSSSASRTSCTKGRCGAPATGSRHGRRTAIEVRGFL